MVAGELHHHVGSAPLHALGCHQCRRRGWVVQGHGQGAVRAGDAHIAQQQVSQQAGPLSAKGTQCLGVLGVYPYLAAGVQAHHAQGQLVVQNGLNGFRVHRRIELSRGAVVAGAGAATHPQELTNLRRQVWAGQQHGRHIG